MAWLSYSGSKYGARIYGTIWVQSDQGGRRKRSMGWVNDDATGNKRNLMDGSNPSRDMRFHIDGRCAGAGVERFLLLRIRDEGVHSENVRSDGIRKSMEKGLGPCRVSGKSLLSGFHRCRSNPSTCNETARQSARNSKADDAGNATLYRGVESNGKARALTADDGDAGADRYAGFQGKRSNGNDARPRRCVCRFQITNFPRAKQIKSISFAFRRVADFANHVESSWTGSFLP